MIDYISQPWHWSISGAMIVVVMVLLTWAGGRFGVSSNLQTLCAMGGAGKYSDYFRIDWKSKTWNLVFIAASVIGGFIASQYLASPEPVEIAEATKAHLLTLGVNTPEAMSEGAGFVPEEIFWDISKPVNWFLLVVGGLLIGFGTRYAGGCTSGHAISGLANLQLASLIAVIGFFIGGLLSAWVIMPAIL
ncbi:YeeE/YedE family protein [Portibacter marinus]|uniref:YeeE/YedE family protein n=1 Tax=Portibacter marinus TaxID=2898660 RepID=UPI001F260745|nr:YeeE/YedE thiosulfate transporter family protein [Portibacter marinus]